MSLVEEFPGVRVRAPGKINVFLAVGGRHDDGYHELATAFQAVSLFEDVYATHSDDFTISVSGAVDVSGVPQDESNLALKAVRLLASETGYPGGVHLDIRKEVPVAGGMGGGSADAAAALVACDALWSTGLGSTRLQALGAQLGADVPFSIMGGTAIGTGRGDELNPALARGRFDWVIVPNAVGMSTPRTYGELDEMRGDAVSAEQVTDPVVPIEILQALRSGDARQLAEALHNDLQAPALRLRPDLREILELGEAQGSLAGIVSGSGPTIAFLVENRSEAKVLEARLTMAGYEAIGVNGPVHGARIV